MSRVVPPLRPRVPTLLAGRGPTRGPDSDSDSTGPSPTQRGLEQTHRVRLVTGSETLVEAPSQETTGASRDSGKNPHPYRGSSRRVGYCVGGQGSLPKSLSLLQKGFLYWFTLRLLK